MTGSPNLRSPAVERKLADLGRVPREVYDLLAETKAPLKAYDLLWLLQAKRGASAPPSTIYRALKVLVDQGLTHKINGLSAYVLCQHADTPHTPAFFICDQCEQATESIAANADNVLTDRIVAEGFRLKSLYFEMRGVCASCRAPQDA